MKTRFMLVLTFILFNFCKGEDSHGEYTLKIKGIPFKRDGRSLVREPKLDTCLRNYKWNSNDIYFYSSEEAFIDFKIEPLIEGKRHLIHVSLVQYKSFSYADQKLKGMMENANKPNCFRPYSEIKDTAFINISPECTVGWAGILYANWFIEIQVTPFGKPQSPQSATDDYKRLKKQILFDFLDNFYPYFLQCAEQAKVPVQEEKN